MNTTQSNLLKAFAGESMARNKYTYYAKRARQEGYEWLAQVFEETAGNERAHAEREFELMKDKVEMTNTYDIHAIGSTLENLKNAAAGEKYEWTSMYPTFKKEALAEGEKIIATAFKEIGEVEEKHEERYRKLAERLESGRLFKTDNPQAEWKCLNCGYTHKGNDAPDTCPACAKPQAFYMQLGFVR
jgi:rubrerythrin